MTGEELDRQALSLYAQSLDLPLEEREAFLREASAGSEELQELLLAMLGVGESPRDRLESFLGKGHENIAGLLELGLEGRRLGDYRLLQWVGSGGVGYVYVAEQVSLRRGVAVKVLDPVMAKNPEIVRRFQREPETQAKLQHPHIVRVINSGTDAGLHYFAMDYIHGTNLSALIKEAHEGGRSAIPIDIRSQPVCAGLIEKVAAALHFAHARGVVHRDVKPHNILIDESGAPFLADFGLAKDVDRTALTQSLEDSIWGSLPYMSPEQATSIHRVDARSDIYSLGAVLYELLTLRPPFAADSKAALLAKVVSADRHAEPPHRVDQGVSLKLSAICTRAMEKAPEGRYASALDMAEDLRNYLAGKPVNARAIRWYRQIGDRRLNRRAVVFGGVGMTGLAFASALITAKTVAASTSASLEIELAGVDAAEVSLRRALAPNGEFEPARPLGAMKRVDRLRVEPDSYRVVVRGENGAFAELQRTLSQGKTARIRPVLTLPGAGGDTMTNVEAGSAKLASTGLFHDSPESAAECDSFWIDRAGVTNREYREFLEATNAWPPPQWDRAWVDLWEGRGPTARPKDWDDLPAVLVTWTSARDFAEWKGKRLPTLAEWVLALGLREDAWLERSWAVREKAFVVDRPQFVDSIHGLPTSCAAYLEAVRPARLDEHHAYGPNKLWHPIGNVSQWLANGPFNPGELGVSAESGMRFTVESPWHFSRPVSELPRFGLAPVITTSADLGFRCAKSADVR